MKRLLSILLILLVASPSWAGGIMMMGGGVPVAALSCSATPFDYQQVQNDWVDFGSTQYNQVVAQSPYVPPSNSTVCRLDFQVWMEVGTIDSYIYTGIIAQLDINGDMVLTTLNTTYAISNNVAGTTVDDGGWITFTFATPFAIVTTKSYAVGIRTNTVHATNYVRTYLATDAGDDWKYSKQGEASVFGFADGAEYTPLTGYNYVFKLYRME